MGQVIQLKNPDRTADAAWKTYCTLVQEVIKDSSLRTQLEHQQNIAKAWARWRDLFLEQEGL
jgi:hypothetical protein